MTYHPPGAKIEKHIDPLAKPYNVGDCRDSFWRFNYCSQMLSAQQKKPAAGKRPFSISRPNPYAAPGSNQSGNRYHSALSVIGTPMYICGLHITVVFWSKRDQPNWNCYHCYFMYHIHGLFFIQSRHICSEKTNDPYGIR